MRPIASNVPTYVLDICLVVIFTNFKYFNSSSIKNNLEIVNKLKDIKIHHNDDDWFHSI